jgi:signal transduction histidine kinase
VEPFVFTRRLALRLLAPTVLVSLVLVAACSCGVLYLNHLHLNASKVLTENVQSTQVAAQLETTTKELMRLLRSDPEKGEALAEQVADQNQRARELRQDAEALANLERERALVRQLSDGLDDYFHKWDQRTQLPADQQRSHHTMLADHLEREVLTPCIELRKYNMSQVEASDLENQRIVSTLRWGLLVVGVGGPLTGLLLGYRVASRLHQSIHQLSVRIRDAAGRLNRELGSVTLEAQGDLTFVHQQMQGVIEEIGRVVDELQQREHEVLRAEQLAAVGQIAAGVAHELRNPLTSIKMFVQSGLEGNHPSGLPAEDLAVIEGEVRRMEQYLQTFLDFARPPRSERRQTDLAAIVHRGLSLVEGRARRQKVTLRAHLPEEAVSLFIDPEQVNQVIVNLLLNALDALPHGGTVRIEVEQLPETETVELRVRDTGTGISPEVSDRLFEPFVTNKETGLGLGLSISRRLIEAHGGRIRGANAPEGGAVFIFTLPLEGVHACAAGRR